MALKQFLTLLFAAAIINPFSCNGQEIKHKQDQHKLLFVFGDSLFDPGNNQYLNSSNQAPATSWPYGMNNHNQSTGRLSDGLIVPDFIGKISYCDTHWFIYTFEDQNMPSW